MYDYTRLLGKIVEKFKTQGCFAAAMGMSERTVSCKINGKVGWKQNEIDKACAILGIAPQDIHAYFFTLNVQ